MASPVGIYICCFDTNRFTSQLITIMFGFHLVSKVAEQKHCTWRKFYKLLAWHIFIQFIWTGRSMQRIYHNLTWSRPRSIILVQTQRQSRNVTADWQRKSTHQGSARRASTHENDCKKMGFWTRVGGVKGEGDEPNTQSGLFLKRAAAGGEENSKWHADLVPGPEGLQGVRCWIYTAWWLVVNDCVVWRL